MNIELSRKSVAIRHLKGSGKVAAALPAEVKTAVIDMAGPYVKSFNLIAVQEGWKCFAGEGDRIAIVYGEQAARVEMAAEHNVGASGLSYDIGAAVIPPVGAFIIRVSYYGGYIMNVYNVQPKAVQA